MDANMQYKLLTPPIKRLPPELVSRIFVYATRSWPSNLDQVKAWKEIDHSSECWYPGMRAETDAYLTEPYSLLLVCRSWKKDALATPDIWSSFTVKCGADLSGDYRRLLNLWIDRSRSAPLSIHIIGENWSTLPQELLRTYERWESVELSFLGDSTTAWKDFLSNIPSARWLRTLSIRYPKIRATEPGLNTPPVSPLFTNPGYLSPELFPELRRVEIAPLILNPTRPNILTHLTIRDRRDGQAPHIQLSQVLELLNSSPHLVHLTVQSDAPPSQGTGDLSHLGRVVHRNLQFLRISAPETHLEALLSRLDLPSVCTLHLSGNFSVAYLRQRFEINTDSSALQNVLLAFLKRSGAALETFRILRTNLTDSQVVELLKCTPNLKELSLYTWELSDSGLKSLTLAPDDISMRSGYVDLCPHLHELSWKYEHTQFSAVQLVNALCSRWQSDLSAKFTFNGARARARPGDQAGKHKDANGVFRTPEIQTMKQKGASLTYNGYTGPCGPHGGVQGGLLALYSTPLADFNASDFWDHKGDYM